MAQHAPGMAIRGVLLPLILGSPSVARACAAAMRSSSVAWGLSTIETRSSSSPPLRVFPRGFVRDFPGSSLVRDFAASSDMVGSGGRDPTAPDYHDQARTPFIVLAVDSARSFQWGEWGGWLAAGERACPSVCSSGPVADGGGWGLWLWRR